jgi:hypothetical protein
MSVFEELADQYENIDQHYSTLEFNASRRGWVRREEEWKRRRAINDQAYFLFMFSRLEDRIREESAKLIREKRDSISRWRQRAPWDLLPKEPGGKMHFKNRLALLCDKDGANFGLVSEYYDERNSIAHGGDFIKPISMPSVIKEMKELYRLLKA